MLSFLRALCLGILILCSWLVISDPEALREVLPLDLIIGPPELRTYDQLKPGMTQGEVHPRERPTRAAPSGGVFTYANPSWTAGCYVIFNETGRVEEVVVVAWD